MRIGGSALVALAFLAIGFTAWQDGATLVSIRLVPALVLIGIGSGFFMTPLLNAILSSVPGPDSGAASGMITTMQQTGSAFGIAVVGLLRSEERRVGKEWCSPCRTRWSPSH